MDNFLRSTFTFVQKGGGDGRPALPHQTGQSLKTTPLHLGYLRAAIVHQERHIMGSKAMLPTAQVLQTASDMIYPLHELDQVSVGTVPPPPVWPGAL